MVILLTLDNYRSGNLSNPTRRVVALHAVWIQHAVWPPQVKLNWPYSDWPEPFRTPDFQSFLPREPSAYINGKNDGWFSNSKQASGQAVK